MRSHKIAILKGEHPTIVKIHLGRNCRGTLDVILDAPTEEMQLLGWNSGMLRKLDEHIAYIVNKIYQDKA